MSSNQELLLITRSYVAALEMRIEKLERRLEYARSRKASVAMHGPDARPAAEGDRKDSLATIRAAIHRKAARRRENSDVNSLVSDFGYLYVSLYFGNGPCGIRLTAEPLVPSTRPRETSSLQSAT